MIDRRGILEEEPFTYHQTKDGKLHISYHGKCVTILKDKRAEDSMKRLRYANEKETQLILAKITGNFKRGNEKRRGI